MTSTVLKILAVIFMVIDHVGEFIPNMPIWFRWIGRLSAPIFFYCSALAVYYSKNRKKYLLRLYFASVLMGIMNFVLMKMIPHTCYLKNNIFRVIFMIVLIDCIIDKFGKNHKEGMKWAVCYIIWQMANAITILIMIEVVPNQYRTLIELIICPLVGSIVYLEGGLIFVALGVGMYCFCFNRKKFSVFYIVFCILHFVITAYGVVTRALYRIEFWGFHQVYSILKCICDDIIQIDFAIPDITWEYILTSNYQWMMLAALPVIFMYNGKRGKGYQSFFYAFYPFHIAALYIIRSKF